MIEVAGGPHVTSGERKARPKRARLLVRLAPWAALAATGAAWYRRERSALRVPVAPPDTPARFEEAEPGRGRAASSPMDIPATGWRDALWRTWREIARDRLPVVAGGVTFYSLLSIFPAIAAFVSLYGLFADVQAAQRQLDQIAAFVPGDVLNIVGDRMTELAAQPDSSLGLAFAVGLLISLWSARTGFAALLDGLNIAYDEHERRPFIWRTLAIYGATITGLTAMSLVLALVGLGPSVLRWLGLTDLAVTWDFARWGVALVLAFGVLLPIYRYGPSRTPPQWRWVVCGAVFASVMWIAGSLGFSWYVGNIARYDVTYGSLGTVVIFMMWVWFSTMVILIGAELNAELEHQTAVDSTVGPTKPIGARGAVMADTVGRAIHPGPRLHRAHRLVGRYMDRRKGGDAPS